MADILDIRGLDCHYGRIAALRGVDLHVDQGEMLAIVGVNGAGKSTLLKAIMNLQLPSRGEILFDGEPTKGLSSAELVGKGLALVPEGRQLFPDLTVLENLELGHWAAGQPGRFDEHLKQVFDAFPRIEERGRQRAGTMSGGEQQMLAIGRALMGNPKVLLLDEPSLGLAPMLVTRVLGILAELNERGLTVVLVEQNANAALRACSRAYVLEAGSVVIEGSTDDLLTDNRVREAYLGVG